MWRSILIVACFFAAPSMLRGQDDVKSYGDTELAKVLADRPSMTGILDDDDVICRWVIRQFNAGDSGKKIQWDSQEPRSGRRAENQRARGEPASIRVTNAASVTGRDRWYLLVFELGNVPDINKIAELNKLVRDRKIDRKTFSLTYVEHEYDSLVRARRFFTRYSIPDCTVENAPMYARYMAGTTIKGDFPQYVRYLDSVSKGGYDPREYFGKYYDKMRKYYDSTAAEIPVPLSAR